MTKSELAASAFAGGYHCSQAVLLAFAEDYGLDPNHAKKITYPLAAGSGVGGECGAVSAAILVVGLEYGISDVEDLKNPEDLKGFQHVFGKLGTFVERFKARNGEISCPKLLGFDVLTEEGLGEFMEKNLRMTQCMGYVEDAAAIVEEIIRRDER